MSSLGELVAGDVQSYGVARRVGHVGKVVEQIERLQDGGYDADADRVVSALDAGDGGTGGCCPIGNECHREAAPQTGVADVLTELVQRTPSGRRGTMRSRHNGSFLFLQR